MLNFNRRQKGKLKGDGNGTPKPVTGKRTRLLQEKCPQNTGGGEVGLCMSSRSRRLDSAPRVKICFILKLHFHAQGFVLHAWNAQTYIEEC